MAAAWKRDGGCVNFGLKAPFCTFSDYLNDGKEAKNNSLKILHERIAKIIPSDKGNSQLMLENKKLLDLLDGNHRTALQEKRERNFKESQRFIASLSNCFSENAVEIQSEKINRIKDMLGNVLENMDEILVQLKTPFNGEHILVPPENQRSLVKIFNLILKEMKVKDQTMDSALFIGSGGIGKQAESMEIDLKSVPQNIAKLTEDLEMLHKRRDHFNKVL